VKLLKLCGAHVWVLGGRRRKGDFPGTMQTPGLADVYAVVPGRDGEMWPLWWEVKAKGGRVRPEQLEFREFNTQACIDSLIGGLDVLEQYLESLGHLTQRRRA
jgi:hypothetical protein